MNLETITDQRYLTVATREIASDQVPAFKIVELILASIDRDVLVIAAGLEFDRDEYVLRLAGNGQKSRAILPFKLLCDIRDDTGKLGVIYTQKLRNALSAILRDAVHKMV
jgi:hypothetical protein